MSKTKPGATANDAPAKRKPAPRAAARAPETPPPDTTDQAAEPAQQEPALFPIVGIGASAGGLGAFREFLRHLPEHTGMGFVLVQHLDPHHESLLAGLLQQATKMPVEEAGDGMAVEPDHVYVIPPNANLGILHGVLQVMERTEVKGRHLAVDYFLQSLAEDAGSRAMGVILSGTGSDGTLGLKAIKAASGITFVQDQASAEYFGMPSSAIAGGWVDFVLPPGEIARELSRIARHPHLLLERPAEAELAEGGEALSKIFMILRTCTGNDFTYYKPSTIRRRIKRRMLLHKLERLDAYARYLQTTPGEAEALFQDILINVTGFFRDPEAFEALKKEAFPCITGDGRPHEVPVRVWIPGCSTGEEAYSVAMALLEYLGDRATGVPVQIFATDIDAKAIEQARTGLYPERISAEVDIGRLQRFFVKVTGGYQVSKAIRDMCVFAVQNVTKDPPFSKIGLVCCRNLMIYLGANLQKKVLQTFHYALQPGGFLLLGTSETIGSHTELFALQDKKSKLYSKKSVAQRVGYDFAVRPPPDEGGILSPGRAGIPTPADIQQEAERLILARYAPPGVIIGENLGILSFRGQTGRYIEPSPGAASLNLLKLARPELAPELRAAIHKALKEGCEVSKPEVRYRHAGGDHLVDLRVLPMHGAPGAEQCLVVLFEADRPSSEDPATAPVAAKGGRRPRDTKAIQELEHELATTREYMQSIIEDQEATNEELKAASEETQSANEELQSTNEELETAKEELQSANEELATVNEELEIRNQDLAIANNDLTNLLASVNLPILMLGQDLRIRQFTPQAEKLLNLIASDLGRPISNIKANVEIPMLDELVMDVIDNMAMRTLELQDNQGTWYSMRVRPYKTQDKRIEGVVITFLEQTERLRQALEQERRLATVVRDANDAIMVFDFDGRIQAWNPAAERIYGWSAAEVLGMDSRRLMPAECYEELAGLLQRLKRGEPVVALKTRRLRRDGSEFHVWLSASPLWDQNSAPYAAATTERDLARDQLKRGDPAASPEAS